METTKLCKYCNKPLFRHYYDEYNYELVCNCDGFRKEQNQFEELYNLNQKVVKVKEEMMEHMLSADISKRLLYLIKQKSKAENEIYDIITKYGITQKQLKEYQDYADKFHEEENKDFGPLYVKK